MPRERQVEFPPEQTHDPRVTTFMLGFCIASVVIVIVLLLAGVDGPFIGPW